MLFQPIVINQISFQRHLKRWMICANEISIIYGVGKRACARARRYDSYFFLRRRCATTDSMAWHGGVWRGKTEKLNLRFVFIVFYAVGVVGESESENIAMWSVAHQHEEAQSFFTDSELVLSSQRSNSGETRELSSCSVRAIWLFMRVMLEHIYEYSCRNGRVVRSAEFGEFSSARRRHTSEIFWEFSAQWFSLGCSAERQNFYDSIFT